MAGNVGNGCCQKCGVHMAGKPHPAVFSVDGYVERRNVLCIGCRDELNEAVNKLWDTWLEMPTLRELQRA